MVNDEHLAVDDQLACYISYVSTMLKIVSSFVFEIQMRKTYYKIFCRIVHLWDSLFCCTFLLNERTHVVSSLLNLHQLVVVLQSILSIVNSVLVCLPLMHNIVHLSQGKHLSFKTSLKERTSPGANAFIRRRVKLERKK